MLLGVKSGLSEAKAGPWPSGGMEGAAVSGAKLGALDSGLKTGGLFSWACRRPSELIGSSETLPPLCSASRSNVNTAGPPCLASLLLKIIPEWCLLNIMPGWCLGKQSQLSKAR